MSAVPVASVASAANHYENFPVASWLCPPHLRPAIRALYAYARTADDLADEGDAAAAERLAALAAYRADLHAAAAGHAVSPRWRPIFEPLGEAIRAHALPLPPLGALLDAFAQDVTVHDYADRAGLLDYCRRSADPVGRLLLHLHGIADEAALARSDAICSGLQLANFWQDLSVDVPRGRLYVPADDRRRHGVTAEALRAGRAEPGLGPLVAELTGWTRSLLMRGAPLVHALSGRTGLELRLVVQGGLRIVERVARLGPRVLHRRPTLGVLDAPAMLAGAVFMRAHPGTASPPR